MIWLVVYEMPAPLGNRFIHLEVNVDFDSFKAYALKFGIHEHLLAFLSFRPQLLHKFSPQEIVWPSPRSWFMANRLYQAGMDIAPAVSAPIAAEFIAYTRLYQSIPDLSAILAGTGQSIPFPKEPSMRYAVAIGLAVRALTAQEAYRGFEWMERNAPAEWIRLYTVDMLTQLQQKQEMGKLMVILKQQKSSKLSQYIQEFRQFILS